MRSEIKHPMGLILDGDMYQELKKRAHDEWRPMSQQIRFTLRAGLEKTSIERLKEKVEEMSQTQAQILAILRRLDPGLKE